MKQNSSSNISSSFKFWIKKDKESKEQTETRQRFSKDFIWKTILNNDGDFNESVCINQLNDIKKIWSIIQSHKTSSNNPLNTINPLHQTEQIHQINQNQSQLKSPRTQNSQQLSSSVTRKSVSGSVNKKLEQMIIENYNYMCEEKRMYEETFNCLIS